MPEQLENGRGADEYQKYWRRFDTLALPTGALHTLSPAFKRAVLSLVAGVGPTSSPRMDSGAYLCFHDTCDPRPEYFCSPTRSSFPASRKNLIPRSISVVGGSES